MRPIWYLPLAPGTWVDRQLSCVGKALYMITVGIIGCNYGYNVLLPAFRSDPRCKVLAIAATDPGRAADLARAANIARGYGEWQRLVDGSGITAVAIAVPPDLQPAIARHALD